MNILLISSNRMKDISPPMPIGLIKVGEFIDKTRHKVRFLDLMFLKNPIEMVKETLREFHPDIVGISIRNVDNQNMGNIHYPIPEVKDIVLEIRKESQAKIILGGTAFNVFPKKILEFTNADMGIVGEGEWTFSELVDRIEAEFDYSDLPGLVFRRNDQIIINPHSFEGLDGYTDSDVGKVNFIKYLINGGTGTVVTKLGCPFKCIFCDGHYQMGQEMRLRPPEEVANHLANMIKSFGIRDFFFIDAHFNVPKAHAKDVCREIIERRLKLRWSACIRPGKDVDEELANLMKEAGCELALVSPDTCSSKMLEIYQKGFTKEEIKESCNALERLKIPYILFILFGGPGETKETVDETIELLRELKPLLVDFSVGIRIMPRTKLAKIALDKGIISSEDDLFKPTFYKSPEISQWIDARIRREWMKHPQWMINGIRLSLRGLIKKGYYWRLKGVRSKAIDIALAALFFY